MNQSRTDIGVKNCSYDAQSCRQALSVISVISAGQLEKGGKKV
jgi:hypothetical protein